MSNIKKFVLFGIAFFICSIKAGPGCEIELIDPTLEGSSPRKSLLSLIAPLPRRSSIGKIAEIAILNAIVPPVPIQPALKNSALIQQIRANLAKPD